MKNEKVWLATPTTRLVPKQQGWEFSPKRWMRLASAAWWLLGKLGALRPAMIDERITSIEKVRRDRPLIDCIAETLRRIPFEHIEGYALVIGVEEFYSLAATSPIVRDALIQPSGVGLEAEIGYRGRLYNVPFHVVSTMTGVALIPKLIIEERRRG